MTMFYWWARDQALRAPLGATEPTQEEFLLEVAKLHERLGGKVYRPHAFKNTVYDSREPKDKLYILWKFHN